MDALAQLYGFGLEIYQLDAIGKLRLVHQFAGPPSGLAPVRLVHAALEEGGPLNHFERLEVDPEHIDATQILEEVIPERDHESGYVVNLPLGTAREFASTLEEFTEWINARQEIYEEALEQGLDEEEATQAANQLDEIAAIIEETGKELKAVEQKAKQALRQKKSAPSLPQAKSVKKAEEALPQKETSVLSLTEVEKKEVVAQQRQILQKAHDKIKTAVTLKGKISKAWHRFLEWWDEPLPANEFYETVKTTANKGAAAHDECMEASAQERPLFTAFAQSVADVEGLNPIYLPETKGQAVLFGITFFKKEPGKRGATAKGLSTAKSRVQKINNRLPINAEYAGKTYPLEKLSESLRQKYPHSVPFTGTGHPDFSRYAEKKVKIKMTGIRAKDETLANKEAGFKVKPTGYAWHHHHDGETMMLVPKDIHKAVGHTGGFARTKFN